MTVSARILTIGMLCLTVGLSSGCGSLKKLTGLWQKKPAASAEKETPSNTASPDTSTSDTSPAAGTTATTSDPTTVPLWRKPYPADAAFGGDLDILVEQQGKILKLTNRTPRSYDDIELWVNQRYVMHVDHIGVGSDPLKLPLSHLTNGFGESYPVPGLLRPDHMFPVLLVEMVLPDQAGKRFRLRVRMKPHR